MLSRFSCVWLFATLWTIACQVPLSMGFSRQQYWSGSPCPPPGNLPYLGMNPCLLCLLHWHEGSLSLTSPGKPDYSLNYCIWTNIFPDTTLSKPQKEISARTGGLFHSFPSLLNCSFIHSWNPVENISRPLMLDMKSILDAQSTDTKFHQIKDAINYKVHYYFVYLGSLVGYSPCSCKRVGNALATKQREEKCY